MSDVAFAAPIELPFEDGDVSVLVRPLSIGGLTKLLARCKPLLDEVMAMPPEVIAGLMSADPTHEDIAYVVTMLCDRGDLGIDVVCIGSGIDRERIASMLPDRFVYLAALVVQVNADFFGKAAPVFQAAVARVKRAAAPASVPGQELSVS